MIWMISHGGHMVGVTSIPDEHAELPGGEELVAAQRQELAAARRIGAEIDAMWPFEERGS